jgi:hypothetical protein
MNRIKLALILGGSVVLFAGCTQATAPARDDTACRGTYTVSSGRDCR